MRLFRRPDFPADLIPLVARQEWERYYLFESRGEEPHLLADDQLAQRCGVDHTAPDDRVRYSPEEMCGAQWACAAAYYAWVDDRRGLREEGDQEETDVGTLSQAASDSGPHGRTRVAQR